MKLCARASTSVSCGAVTALLAAVPAFAQIANDGPPVVARSTPAIPPSSTAPVGNASAGAAIQAGAGAAPASASVAEVVVTARKTTERLRDVPISVTVVGSDQLQKEGVTSANDLAKVVPSFTYQTSNTGTPIYAIRGVQFAINAVAASPTVASYLDQAPLPYSLNTKGTILDLERVEVLKGPQGTTFGQNSTAGAINFIAAKPTQTYQSAGELSYSRFNEVDAEAYVSGPIAQNVTARIAARTEQRFDGYQQASLPGDDRTNGVKDFATARLIVDWTPSDRLKFELTASGWRDRSDTPAAQYLGYAPSISPGAPLAASVLPTYPISPRNPRAAEFDQGFNLRDDENQGQITFRADYDVNPYVVATSITSYLHLDTRLPNDPDGTSFPAISYNTESTINTFSQELRLANSHSSRLTWVVGANYEHDNAPESNVFTNFFGSSSQVGPFAYHDFVEQNNQYITTVAGFVNAEFKILPTVAVQGGVRYTTQVRDQIACVFDSGNGQLAQSLGFIASLIKGAQVTIPAGACATLDAAGDPVTSLRNHLDQNNVSWRAGLSWKPRSTTLVYANVTQGYKAGGFDTLPLFRAVQDTPVVQESLRAYEAGLKTTVLPRKVDLEASFFYYNYDNKQIQGTVDTGFPFGSLPALVNIPHSRVIGIDYSVTLHPIPPARINLGGTYAQSRVTDDFISPSPVGTPVDLKGEAFPNSPRFQLVADGEYDLPLVRGFAPYVGANTTYRTASYAQVGEDYRFKIPDFAVLDARAGVYSPDRSWSVQIFGRNVTNKLYATTITREVDTIARTAGFPATYGVLVSHKFF